MREPNQICGTCRSFKANENNPPFGHCKRFPPQIIVVDDWPNSRFPAVEGSDYCDEWRLDVPSHKQRLDEYHAREAKRPATALSLKDLDL